MLPDLLYIRAQSPRLAHAEAGVPGPRLAGQNLSHKCIICLIRVQIYLAIGQFYFAVASSAASTLKSASHWAGSTLSLHTLHHLRCYPQRSGVCLTIGLFATRLGDCTTHHMHMYVDPWPVYGWSSLRACAVTCVTGASTSFSTVSFVPPASPSPAKSINSKL